MKKKEGTLGLETGSSVKHPSHYNVGGLETIEVIKLTLTEEQFIGFCLGNIIKYRERAPFKGNMDEDYQKALEYKAILDGVKEND